MIKIEKLEFQQFSCEKLKDGSEEQIEVVVKDEYFENIIESNIKGKYKCEYCEKIFTRKDRLDRHLFSHTGLVSIVPSISLQPKTLEKANEQFPIDFQKQFKCTYEGCKMEYSCDSHLRRHIRTSHEETPVVGSFVCKFPSCAREFTNISNMHRHFKQQHTLTYFFPCLECDAHFRRKMKLRTHMIEVHKQGNYRYTCPTCEKGFHNLPMYSKHLAVHKIKKEDRPCDDCDLTFPTWSALVKHRRESHKIIQVSRFTCDLCSKIFTWKKSLKVHMKVHETHRTEVYECTFKDCSKQYTTKSNLKAHIRSKHEGKNFKCSFCSLELTTKQRYDQHVKNHQDPTKKVKESCLSLLLGLEMKEVDKDKNELMIMPPKTVEVATESEFSD